MNDVLALYGEATPVQRAFLSGRVLLSDLDFIERFVPDCGTIVDLGCGHGLFANLMAMRSASRRVIGIDPSAARIRLAAKTVGNRANIEFIRGDVSGMDVSGCDAITIVDVLYLLPRAAQQLLLKECRRLLRPGGVLVWKAQERRPRWKFALTWFQELVATTVRFTQWRVGRLEFMSREEALAALAAAGFEARVVEMKSRRPYTDILYLAEASPAPGISG